MYGNHIVDTDGTPFYSHLKIKFCSYRSRLTFLDSNQISCERNDKNPCIKQHARQIQTKNH